MCHDICYSDMTVFVEMLKNNWKQPLKWECINDVNPPV